MIVYAPVTEKGKAELSRRVAAVHVENAIRIIDRQSCPVSQKLKLADGMIEAVKKKGTAIP